MKVNMSDKIKVKLTEKGLQILSSELIKFPELYRMYTKIDENGYSEFQLWSLMNLFGSHMYNGCEIPFETDIELIDIDYKEDLLQ